MGGPHVTECVDEALGRDGGPRHADAVALGEADVSLFVFQKSKDGKRRESGKHSPDVTVRMRTISLCARQRTRVSLDHQPRIPLPVPSPVLRP